MSAQSSLTGVWQGLYSYPVAVPPVSFTATLIDVAGSFSGTTHEKGPGGGTLLATLAGRRDGGAVNFRKTYVGGPRGYGEVAYEGTLASDGTEIEGRWTLPNGWSGKFLMTRPSPARVAAERKLSEPV